jgi:hypothetical protein
MATDKRDEVFLEMNASMKKAPNDIVVQQSCCFAMLVNMPSRLETSVNMDLFYQVLFLVMNALKAHPEATYLQVVGLSVISKLGRLNDDFAKFIVKGRGFMLVEEAYINTVAGSDMWKAAWSVSHMLTNHMDSLDPTPNHPDGPLGGPHSVGRTTKCRNKKRKKKMVSP